MKQSFLAIVLALSSATGWANENLGYLTSGQLYETCRKPVGEYACTMFILGVFQGMDAQAYLSKAEEQCIPLSDMTNGDLKNIVTGHLAANKQHGAEPAATAVILALGSDECKAKLMPQH